MIHPKVNYWGVPENLKWKLNNKYIYNWFSNMEYVNINYNKNVYPSVENFYQAMKCKWISDRAQFLRCSPYKSKSLSRKIEIRDDWDDIKINCMNYGLNQKFIKYPKWKTMLLETKEENIIEWNNWNDTFWGVNYKTGLGRNILGILLMNLRNKL